ncbi:ComF family protein [Allorhizobium undicola]|uniref:ComF family protein n=1 Tax=Allorhizobium undicola TaxID=78527 RepID=UPI0009FDFAF9|nr:ComF family protein [Allorhizobium undicola]
MTEEQAQREVTAHGALTRLFARGFASGLRRLGDVIYPPSCAACGLPVAAGMGLCSGCWRTMRFITPPFCAVLGVPFSYDPGEGMVSGAALASPPAFDRLRAVAVHDGVARELVHKLKYADRTDLAPMMARWMARAGADILAEVDGVVPVPLHRWRLFHRQYNQSAELARWLCRHTGKSFMPNVLRRVKATRKQVGLTKKKRADNVRGAFHVPQALRERVAGRHILLVDDVFTTGATIEAATRALKASGAAGVSVLTFAMAISGPI